MIGLEPMMILLHLLGSTFITDLVMGTNEYASSKGYYIFNYIHIYKIFELYLNFNYFL